MKKTDIMGLVESPSPFVIRMKGLEFKVKPFIPYGDGMNFAQNIATGVTTVKVAGDDGLTVSFAVKDFLIRKNTIIYFTNIELPANEEQQNDILYCTNIYETIINDRRFDKAKYEELLRATDDQIDYEVQSMLSLFRGETQSYLRSIENECETILNTMRPIVAAFEDSNVGDITSAFKTLAKLKPMDVDKAVAELATEKVE